MSRRPARPRLVTCGVLVTDGARLLVARPPRFPLWDIPKGLAEPGETHAGAAARELREETGIEAAPGALVPLGGGLALAYRPGKDLALFVLPRAPDAMPDPAALRCSTLVRRPDGPRVPEVAHFAVLPWAEAASRVGGNLARRLVEARADPAWPYPSTTGEGATVPSTSQTSPPGA